MTREQAQLESAPPKAVVDAFIDSLEKEGFKPTGLREYMSNPYNIDYNDENRWFYEGPRGWFVFVHPITTDGTTKWTFKLRYAFNTSYGSRHDVYMRGTTTVAKRELYVHDGSSTVHYWGDFQEGNYTYGDLFGLAIKQDNKQAAQEAMGDELGGLLDL